MKNLIDIKQGNWFQGSVNGKQGIWMYGSRCQNSDAYYMVARSGDVEQLDRELMFDLQVKPVGVEFFEAKR